jgi:hypothetical protein
VIVAAALDRVAIDLAKADHRPGEATPQVSEDDPTRPQLLDPRMRYVIHRCGSQDRVVGSGTGHAVGTVSHLQECCVAQLGKVFPGLIHEGQVDIDTHHVGRTQPVAQ